MNQSSLYHYFKSKEDILYKLMNDAMDDALATLEKICAATLLRETNLKKALAFTPVIMPGTRSGLFFL